MSTVEPTQIQSPELKPDSSNTNAPRRNSSPARRSVSINISSIDGGINGTSASKSRPNTGDMSDLLNSVEFVPTAEGTPAALALAGMIFPMGLSLFPQICNHSQCCNQGHEV